MSGITYYERLIQDLNQLVNKSETIEKEREKVCEPVIEKIEENKLKIRLMRRVLKEKYDKLEENNINLKNSITKKANIKELFERKLKIDKQSLDFDKTNEDFKKIKKKYREFMKPYIKKKADMSREMRLINDTIYKKIKSK